MFHNDSDRPPVLAHQRFLNDRGSFAGLNLAQRFQRIHDTNLWGAPASLSGLGSEIDATAALRAELPRLLEKLGVASLLDAPCGDAGWINRANLDVRYVGVDIAAWLIVTTFPEWQSNADCEDGDWRALNFERAPFDWGPPAELINENCTEAGGGWRDKSLGVWRLAEIG